MDKFMDGKFSNPVNPKDGFILTECEDVHAHRMLEILISIL